MANVLIPGGAGYIGGWLTDRALEAGHEVRVYDLLLYEDRYLKEVDFVAGDVLDTERLAPHLEWADTVVWLAALVGDPACALDSTLTRKINLESVQLAVRQLRRPHRLPLDLLGLRRPGRGARRAEPDGARCRCTRRPSSRPSGC